MNTDWKKYYNEEYLVLNLPYQFNDLLVNLPFGIKSIFFPSDSRFNQKVDSLPNSLTYLFFGNDFNQNIDKLPSSLKELELGYSFNQNVDKLPCELTHLTFGDNFNQDVDKLPSTLTHLRFGRLFDRNVDNLPPNLKYLAFGKNFNKNVDNLPKSLISLTFGRNFNQSIEKIPDNFIAVGIARRAEYSFLEGIVIVGSIKLIDNFISSKINTVVLFYHNCYIEYDEYDEIIDNLPSNIKRIRISAYKLHLIKKIPFECRIFDNDDNELFL